MDREFDTALSTHDEQSVTVREKDLTTEVMGEMSFPAALYYLWTGEEPADGEERLVDAVLSSLMVHGTTPSEISARMTALSAPEAPQAAIAAGILGVGSRYVGPMKECAEQLRDLVAAEDTDAAVEDFVTESVAAGERFPGIGHPYFDPVDPRAQRLFEIADSEDIAGDHVATLESVREGFEARTDRSLPINVTGAIAALAADVGMAPTAARGLAVVSRAAGVTAAVLEEETDPIAGDIWAAVDAEATDWE